MKIGVVGPIWLNIPPRGYGGTEIVVANLVNSLSVSNDVSLFGPKTSKVKAHVIPTVDKPLFEMGKGWDEKEYNLNHIKRAFDMVSQFDILHVQLNRLQDYEALPLAVKSKTPVLFTPHFLLPTDKIFPERAKILEEYSFLPFSSISDSQRKGSKLNFVGTVYNGLEIGKYKFNPIPEDYFVWIGKLIPEKGAKEAIQVAKKAHVKLYILGLCDKENPVSVEYYEKDIKPEINGKDIFLFGEVNFEEKTKILARAKAFIFPLQWDEPFGMVMIEAQALGTPVIALRHGSAGEVVAEGKSGFIVDDLSSMIERIGEIDKINRSDVRANAELFTADKMAQGYEKIYRKVIDNWNIYLKNSKIGNL